MSTLPLTVFVMKEQTANLINTKKSVELLFFKLINILISFTNPSYKFYICKIDLLCFVNLLNTLKMHALSKIIGHVYLYVYIYNMH